MHVRMTTWLSGETIHGNVSPLQVIRPHQFLATAHYSEISASRKTPKSQQTAPPILDYCPKRL